MAVPASSSEHDGGQVALVAPFPPHLGMTASEEGEMWGCGWLLANREH
jgi:hypothetical protein